MAPQKPNKADWPDEPYFRGQILDSDLSPGERPDRNPLRRPGSGPVKGPRHRSSGPRRSPLPLRVARTGAALVSVLVLGLTGAAWYELRATGTTLSGAIEQDAPKSLGGDMNILLIGLDSRKDQDGNPLPPEILDKLHAGDETRGGYNTNTLILMHVPADGSKAVAFSIPRDSLVNIPGRSEDKIKKAYGFAKADADERLLSEGVDDKAQREAQSREAGRKATLGLVRDLTGVPIDHFAEVNLAGFYDVANALGRVHVCLKKPTRDDFSGANFPAGHQWIDGQQALSFVRQRNNLPNGDLDRTRRQQAFLSAVSEQLRSTGTLTNPARLQGLLKTVKQDVVIDSGWDLLGFAQQAQGLSGRNLQFNTLPVEGFDVRNGEDVNIVDPVKIRNIVRTAFGVQPPPAEPTRADPGVVDVVNASGATGVAAQVAEQLKANGMTSGDTTTAASRQKTSQVLHASGSTAAAERVAGMLGGMPVAEDPALPPGRVRVVLGSDYSPDRGSTTTPQSVVAPPRSQPPSSGGPSGDIPCVD